MHVFPCRFGDIPRKDFFMDGNQHPVLRRGLYSTGSTGRSCHQQCRTASITATGKNGTSHSGTTMKGACRGHSGVDKKAPAEQTAPTAAKSGANTAMAQAAGGSAGKIWVNDASKVSHCEGAKYCGKTKQGEYMGEADAKAKGFHPDHGKVCK